MRVVFDTNVVISGMLWGGSPRRALEQIHLKRAVLLSSQPLLDELTEVVTRPKFVARLAQVNTTSQALLHMYLGIVEMVEPADVGQVVQADPKDDKFLACAVGGAAQAVVSGDHHLLDLQHYAGITILTIEQFLQQTILNDD